MKLPKQLFFAAIVACTALTLIACEKEDDKTPVLPPVPTQAELLTAKTWRGETLTGDSVAVDSFRVAQQLSDIRQMQLRFLTDSTYRKVAGDTTSGSWELLNNRLVLTPATAAPPDTFLMTSISESRLRLRQEYMVQLTDSTTRIARAELTFSAR